jgi:hypothetical protein
VAAENQKFPIPSRSRYAFPAVWNAGDTIKWTVSIPDYPADEGWTLTYEVKSRNGHIDTITASASGADYEVTVAAATSAAYEVGDHHYRAYVTKAGERFTVDSGTVKVIKDFEDAGLFDGRGHAEKVLEAIETVIEGRATKDQESYTIAGRSLARTPIQDLLVLRDRYRAEVRRLENEDRVARGLGTSKTIRTRFTGLS